MDVVIRPRITWGHFQVTTRKPVATRLLLAGLAVRFALAYHTRMR